MKSECRLDDDGVALVLCLASEVTLMNIRNARKVFEKLEKDGART